LGFSIKLFSVRFFEKISAQSMILSACDRSFFTLSDPPHETALLFQLGVTVSTHPKFKIKILYFAPLCSPNFGGNF
jgi:hypothetical protein